MESRVRKHVNNLFKTFEQNEHTLDTKEELISNLIDRINDSIDSGMSDDEAFDIAVGNLGTTSELRKIFNFKSIRDFTFEYNLSSMYASIATVIYLIIGFVFDLWHPGWAIFIIAMALSNFKVNDKKSYIVPGISLIYVFIGLMWDLWHPGWLIFPIGFIVFSSINKKYGALWLMVLAIYITLGMLFGEWLIFSLIFLISAALVAGRDEIVAGLWLFTIAAYLAMGFAFDLWHPGWLIGGVTLALTVIIVEKSIVGFSWVVALSSYLLIGFTLEMWHPTWVVFVVAAAISAYFDKEELGIKAFEVNDSIGEFEQEEI